MSYGKKASKFKPKVPALQGRGSGEKKIEKKEKFYFSILKDWELFKKKQARAGPSVLN